MKWDFFSAEVGLVTTLASFSLRGGVPFTLCAQPPWVWLSFWQIQGRLMGAHTRWSPPRRSCFRQPAESSSWTFLYFWSVEWFPLCWSCMFPFCRRRTVPWVQWSLRGEAVSRGHAVCRLRSQQETVPLPVSTGEARRVLRCRVGCNDEVLNSQSWSPLPLSKWHCPSPFRRHFCLPAILSFRMDQNWHLPSHILGVYGSCSLCEEHMPWPWAPDIMRRPQHAFSIMLHGWYGCEIMEHTRLLVGRRVGVSVAWPLMFRGLHRPIVPKQRSTEGRAEPVQLAFHGVSPA